MPKIPHFIFIKWAEVIKDYRAISRFAEWIYKNPGIGGEIGEDNYESFLVLDYDGKFAREEVRKLIYSFVPPVVFEYWRLSAALTFFSYPENYTDYEILIKEAIKFSEISWEYLHIDKEFLYPLLQSIDSVNVSREYSYKVFLEHRDTLVSNAIQIRKKLQEKLDEVIC